MCMDTPVKIMLVTSDAIGEPNPLGKILMKGFLTTLWKNEELPARLILLNTGVRMAAEDEAAAELLAGLAARGVEILSCGTCLDYYGLRAALKVGAVTNMHDTVAALAAENTAIVTVG